MGISNSAAVALALTFLCGSLPAIAASTDVPAATAAAAPASRPSPGEVVARVNGAPITRAEVDRALRVFVAQSRSSHDVPPEVQKEAQEAALEQLVGIKLLYEKGRTLKIDDLETQVAEKVAAAKKKLPSEEAYRTALEANQLTENEAQQIVRTDIVVAAVLEREVVGKVSVSEEESKKFYRENMEKFTSPPSVELRHILIEVDPGATPEEKRKAREKAEGIRRRLIAGADFATLAQEESQCPSRDEGGALGRIEKNELLPEFEKGTERLQPGEISEVTQTQFGFHVIKLVARHESAVASFDSVKEKIEYYLKEKKVQQAIVDYVAALKGKASIERVAGT